MNQEIDNLVLLAEKALSFSDDEFFENVEDYLTAFATWQEQLSPEIPQNLSEEEKSELKQTLEKLVSVHHEISERSEKLKDELGSKLGDFHKRGKALRQYVDRYPKRISITGKRKG